MKRLLTMLFAGLMVLSLAGRVYAQPDDTGKGQSTEKKSKEKEKKKKKKHHKKHVVELRTGSGAVTAGA